MHVLIISSQLILLKLSSHQNKQDESSVTYICIVATNKLKMQVLVTKKSSQLILLKLSPCQNKQDESSVT